MWPFAQPNKSSEIVPHNPHANITRLAAVEVEFREAENEFNVAFDRLKRHMKTHRDGEPFTLANVTFVPLNNRRDLERSLLVHEEFVARTRRDKLLAERAELRRSLGLTR